ncbi:hypothetical protein [Otariodibacter oris]|uniref:Lipoprotein n=1 Tax=Otariodibacter oris TaxID=1032623 RepID=A0A420XGK7_9PAST|nr:hypothetical protein [Otariodibacter oris]QGM81108.1 hypothetical protein A6A10_06670 [Otariodibacter oris]RKR72660.1 hypothetical protein DES31_0824 [Otariodibacter oris]
MKKELSIVLGLSFALVGCFDASTEDKAKSVESDKAPTATMNIQAESTKDKDTEAQAVKDLSDNKKLSENNSLSDDQFSKDEGDDAQNIKDIESRSSVTSGNEKSEKNNENTTLMDSQETLTSEPDKGQNQVVDSSQPAVEKQEDNSTQAVVEKQENDSAQAVAEKQTRQRRSRNRNVASDGLSDEERRVGQQQIYNKTQIDYLKSQCRYPYMSPAERQRYDCYIKPATVR